MLVLLLPGVRRGGEKAATDPQDAKKTATFTNRTLVGLGGGVRKNFLETCCGCSDDPDAMGHSKAAADNEDGGWWCAVIVNVGDAPGCFDDLCRKCIL